jgi:tripartite-type tricarboxylate transporter receptor subunit TctC
VAKTNMAVLRMALLVGCAALTVAAQAQKYPTQPVRVIVAFPPGSGVDIVERLVTAKLSTAMGQQFIIDNRGGAGGSIGAALAARAAPDGYTLLGSSDSIAAGPALYKDLPFKATRDFRGVALLASVPFFLVENPGVPAKSLTELIALAKSRPGSLTFGSTGNGSQPHFAAETFMMQAKIDLRHVPYRGSAAALTDLMAGQINVMFANVLSVLPQIQAGRLRALAITSTARNANLPNVPTMAEAGLPGFYWVTWFALLAPAGTPSAIVDSLNAEVAKVLKMPDVQKTLDVQGATARSGTPAEVDAFIKSETTRYQEVVQKAGIKLE